VLKLSQDIENVVKEAGTYRVIVDYLAPLLGCLHEFIPSLRKFGSTV
jgi:hypothetical protein